MSSPSLPLAVPVPRAASRPQAPLHTLTGFFFAFRIAITYLAFQSDPRLGTIVNLGASILLLGAATLYTFGDKAFTLRFTPTLRWLGLYLAVVGFSLLYTAADSTAIAAGYWLGMAMDIATTLLLLKPPSLLGRAESLFRGFVLGSLIVAAVAWLSPTLPDLRIGNEDFLHPNGLGLEFAIATLLAQHLARTQLFYKLAAIVLGLSLLRTLSKTSIVAFLVAETLLLLRASTFTRRARFAIGGSVLLILAACSSLLEAYFTLYAANGNSAETLTGRIPIWATALSMSMEHPILGHGLYSFRALIPAFGNFQPWHAHNELLQQFFEFGFVGVLTAFGLYIALFRASRAHRASPFAALAATLVIFSLIHGITDTVNFGLSLPLWLFTAFAVTLSAPEAAA